MAKQRDVIQYDLESYDKHYCLKPSLATMVAAAFASRAYLLPLLIVLGSLKGGVHYETDALLGNDRTLSMVTEIPALLVIYAMIRRTPSASAAARWIWKNGRLLLAASLLLDLCLALRGSGWQVMNAYDDDVGTLVRMTADVAVLFYLAISARVRDTFADFPAAPSGSAPGGGSSR